METETDRELIAALRRGDSSAFDRVYAEYRPRIFGFLLRLSRRRDVAEEIVQETFVRLARRAGALLPDTRLAPWLFTVARNQWVSHVRMRMAEADRLEELSFRSRAPAAAPSDEAATNEQLAKLERALTSLSAPHREVLLLVGVEGLEPTEAAAIIRINPDAMRQRLSRARAALRQALERAERMETKRGGAR